MRWARTLRMRRLETCSTTSSRLPSWMLSPSLGTRPMRLSARGDVPVLEHDGALYSCDHFVDDAHRLGNIAETPLGALLTSNAQLRFGRDKRDRLPGYCLKCPVLDMCNGGCPKDRFVRSPDGEEGLNYLCPGFKAFFTHARPVFGRLVPLWKAGASAEDLMRAARGGG